MVFVDTTVWIDFFADLDQPHVVTLSELIEQEEDLSLCGIILAEVLQGIRSDKDFIKTREYLGGLVFLPMGQATFLRAAEVYRSLRKKGVTIRKPVDCMIASVAMEYDICLLHNDRDFDHIARHSGLRVFSTKP
ncbi:PilT protein domain protein [Desulfonatronospira thiodismutans ASO3-1]|uniref:Ribonuclease VapC n=1 Tax=Desulfonatronospira thiodismutans ASO3-1 TaxID=555779 RepID=D6SU35_9BACT|nr:PIN domain nuclease [Desulfonatronospira thiodismutans]EFI33126.1 PilT protein domain protein [Desulfonatronospira thiodismutans ASO3-1]